MHCNAGFSGRFRENFEHLIVMKHICDRASKDAGLIQTEC